MFFVTILREAWGWLGISPPANGWCISQGPSRSPVWTKFPSRTHTQQDAGASPIFGENRDTEDAWSDLVTACWDGGQTGKGPEQPWSGGQCSPSPLAPPACAWAYLAPAPPCSTWLPSPWSEITLRGALTCVGPGSPWSVAIDVSDGSAGRCPRGPVGPPRYFTAMLFQGLLT